MIYYTSEQYLNERVNDKVFNLNPLYLDEWIQLEDFGVEVLVVYNNLIPYQELVASDSDYKNVKIIKNIKKSLKKIIMRK